MKSTSFIETSRHSGHSYGNDRLCSSSPPEVSFADELTPLIRKDLNGRVRETIEENDFENESTLSISSTMSTMSDVRKRHSRKRFKVIFHECKSYLLVAFIIVATGLIAATEEVQSHFHQYVVDSRNVNILLNDRPGHVSGAMVRLRGTFSQSFLSFTNNLTLMIKDPRNDSRLLGKSIVPYVIASKAIPNPQEIVLSQFVEFGSLLELNPDENLTLELSIEKGHGGRSGLPVGLDYQVLRYNLKDATWWGAAILVFVYILISFELVHRTVAATIGSLLVMAVLSTYNLRPTLAMILTWIDFETLMLLFGMMLIVGIFSETGFFDWVALMAYTFARGRVFVLLALLCGVAAVVSAFLDNVTTILLLAPVTIRLCEVLRMVPQRFLLAEVIFSNIGGAATAVGDPPNVLIVSNDDLRKAVGDSGSGSVDFVSFILHMGLGSIFVLLVSAAFCRFLLRGLEEDVNSGDFETRELQREVAIWRRSAMAISVGTREESSVRALLLAKHEESEARLRRRQSLNRRRAEDGFRTTVLRLQAEYKIRNKCLLIKTLCVLSFVIIAFVVCSVFDHIYVDLGWIAFLGAVWLLLLSDYEEMDALMHRVEWSTLIFFAALFTFMKGIEELGLISFIGDAVADLVASVDPTYRLLVAILMVQWVSAIVSAVIDNIPFTTAMIPVIISISHTGVPLLPLVWALAFGTCLGGNGTLIGASANVVAVGIADQHGYSITFTDFMKIGFPMMLVSNTVATIFLVICHVSPIAWNFS